MWQPIIGILGHKSNTSYTKTLVTLVGLVNIEDWIEVVLFLGFSVDDFLTKLAIFLVFNFFIVESAHPFIETLVTLFGLVHFED